jgi:D-hydroxyproline dehydrogenase subunit gamma
MAQAIEIVVDGRRVEVLEGTPLAVALMDLGLASVRVSVTGQARGPICGMGICFECRVTIGGYPHQRSCLVPCVAGLVVETAAR